MLPHVLGFRLTHPPHHRVDGALVFHAERARAHATLDSSPGSARRRCRRAGSSGEIRGASSRGRSGRSHAPGPPRARCRCPRSLASPTAPRGFTAPSLTERSGLRHHERGIHLHPDAEAGALRAHSLGRVEGEQLRRGLGEREPAVVTGPVLRENHLRLARPGITTTIPSPWRSAVSTESVSRRVDARLGDEAVDDGVDRVLLFLVEPDRVVERENGPVHPHPGEAGLAHLLDHLAVLTLALLHERGEDEELRTRRELQDLPDDLLGRLLRDGPPAAGGS